MRLVIDWPLPPSTNRLWRVTRDWRGKVRVYKNPKYRAFQLSAGLQWMLQRPKGFKTIDEQFIVSIIICPKRKNRDLENNIKALLDTCQEVGVITDDKNCTRHTAWLGDQNEAPLGARIIITTRSGS
jgi:Holliday junction resolvase RusA-like endonuclease